MSGNSRKSTDLGPKFWARVLTGDPRGCWRYLGPRHRYTGRGLFSVSSGRLRQAHRVAYELAVGPIPEGLYVLHTCNNGEGGCVNPAHLYAGTQVDNMRDRKARGVPYENGRGKGYRAKVNAEQVREMRRRVAAGESRAAMAREFGISRMQASTIVARKAWRHVEN